MEEEESVLGLAGVMTASGKIIRPIPTRHIQQRDVYSVGFGTYSAAAAGATTPALQKEGTHLRILRMDGTVHGAVLPNMRRTPAKWSTTL